MSPIDILIILGCIALTIGVIFTSIKNKKNGKTSCGCNCSTCLGCANRQKKEQQVKD